MNSHYVPKFILKNFGEKISLYDISSGKLCENTKLDKAYSKEGFYSDAVEDKLNRKIESQFANIFNNKISKCNDKIILNRKELRLIKKFLLISVIRSVECEKFLQKEKRFYDRLKDNWIAFAKAQNLIKQSMNI